MDIRKAASNLQEAGRAIGQQGHEQEGHKPV
jgi:hypothetical protein